MIETLGILKKIRDELGENYHTKIYLNWRGDLALHTCKRVHHYEQVYSVGEILNISDPMILVESYVRNAKHDLERLEAAPQRDRR
ncbi:hypothetical protein [Primorskyibacter sedentarius]|uniref:hypothetical protein n=1 Tax=Primorskyibacter sedentarius TaxID=745311 RepID=UPI003EBB9179